VSAPFPSRDEGGTIEGGTIRPARRCAGCGRAFAPTGRQQHCSSACRKRVFRARHRTAPPAHAVELAAAAAVRRSRREHTVYECPDCATRQLGVQRCEDCGRFGRALGLGGTCPGCADPVTLTDLGLDPDPDPDPDRIDPRAR
jgi:predicted nucleic acid-binding Zn ribbon protein